MLKNDKWIKQSATISGMISPFCPSLIREVKFCSLIETGVSRKVISYGTSSYGYDIRLSPNDFRVFRHIPGTVINPKSFNPDNLHPVELQEDEDGSFFILPGHSYGLGVSLELVKMPENITAICLGKSTYARCGIIANCTPIEAMWGGHITLEFSNSSNADCRIYANEGVCQLLFLEGEPCEISYEDRKGKYQNQGHEVTLARV